MKRRLLYTLSILLLLCATPHAQAGFVITHKAQSRLNSVTTIGGASQDKTEQITRSNVGYSGITDMPRGRGNGRQAIKSFYLGWFSIFPFLGLLCVPFAYILGFKNLGRKRKGRGFAIAGIVMATIGLAFSLAIIIAG